MGSRAGRVLNWTADNVGNVYFLAMSLIVVTAIGGCVTLAIVTGQLAFLLILLLPAFWLLMLATGL